MPDENEERLERQRTAEIVAAYVRHHQLAADKVPALISTIHATLGQLGRSAQPVIEPAVPIRRSVHRDYVVLSGLWLAWESAPPPYWKRPRVEPE
jgi:predicted transcriptional regulator